VPKPSFLRCETRARPCAEPSQTRHTTTKRTALTQGAEFWVSCSCLSVVLNVLNLGHGADGLDGRRGELAGVAADVAVVDLAEAGGEVRAEERLVVCGGEEVHVVLDVQRLRLGLEDDDVRVVEAPVRVVPADQGRQRPRAPGTGSIVRGRERRRNSRADDGEDNEGEHGRSTRGVCERVELKQPPALTLP
jgi:hypothetical protein